MNRKICTFFSNGNCMYGEDCKNIHDSLPSIEINTSPNKHFSKKIYSPQNKKKPLNISKVAIIDSKNEKDDCTMVLESCFNFSTKKDGFLDKQEKKFKVKILSKGFEKKNDKYDKIIPWTQYTIAGELKNVHWTFWNLKMEGIRQKTTRKGNTHEKTNHWKRVDLLLPQDEFSFSVDDNTPFDNYFHLISAKEKELIDFPSNYKPLKGETEQKFYKFSKDKMPDFSYLLEVLKKEPDCEFKLTLGHVLFYNKRYEDLSKKKISFQTISKCGTTNDQYLRTTTSSCFVSTKWNVLRKYFDENDFNKENSQEIFVKIAAYRETFFYTIDQSRGKSNYSHYSKLYMSNYVFTDEFLDILITTSKRVPTENPIKFDKFDKIDKMIEQLKNINDDITIEDGFFLNYLPVEMNWKYNTLISGLEIRKFERYTKGKYTVELETKSERHDFCVTETNDTALHIFNNEIKDNKFTQEDIEDLYQFGLEIKKIFEMHQK